MCIVFNYICMHPENIIYHNFPIYYFRREIKYILYYYFSFFIFVIEAIRLPVLK